MKNENKRPRLDRVSLAIVVVFTILGAAAALGTFRLVRDMVLPMQALNLPGLAISSTEVPIPGMEGTPGAPGSSLQEAIVPTPQPWDGASRVSVLVMGLDYRDWEAGETPRSDSMILFSLDPVTKKAGMLSIPRDLWVNIPGFGHAKINTAYFLGESSKLPGGGPALAVQTVENFLGMPIQYYARIDWAAFIKFVDTIGGIDVNVKEEVVIDPLGPGNTIKVFPGVQTFDGATALAYARARHTDNEDFDRARRQQDVIIAVRDQVVNFYSLPKLIQNAPQMYEDLSSGIATNMTLDEAIRLAWIVKDIPTQKINRGVIQPPKMVLYGKSPDGLDILQPVPDAIRVLRNKVFRMGGPGPAGSGDLQALVKQEGGRISLWNGTQDPNIIIRTAEYFKSFGMNVVEIAAADQSYNQSQIIINSGRPYVVRYLASLMKIDTNRIAYQGFNPDGTSDVILIIGNDWLNENTLP